MYHDFPKTIHRIWLGGPMPTEFAAYEQKWRELHPDWVVRTWGDKDLQWLRNRPLFETAESYAEKSDVARYEIILKHGGVYVDTDFEPLRSLDAAIDAPLVFTQEKAGVFSNGFFGAVPNHPFIAFVVESLPQSIDANQNKPANHRTGPVFFSRCHRRWRSDNPDAPFRVLDRDDVYPYHPLSLDSRQLGYPWAHAVHHWAHSWAPQTGEPGFIRQTWGRLRKRVRRVLRRCRRLFVASPTPQSLQASVYVGDGCALVQTTAGFPLRVLTADLGISAELMSRGTYDPAFLAFLKREVRPGDVVVDVGANIGLVTVAAANAVGWMGRVFAFEPHAKAHAVAVQNVHMCKMQGYISSEVVVRRVAVGAEPLSGATLYSPENDPGLGRLGSPSTTAGELAIDKHETEVVTLDEELAKITEIRLVKIDVEGGEANVLRGMRRLIEQNRIRLIDIELIDAHVESWGALSAEIALIVEKQSARLFRLNADGRRVPLTLTAALWGGDLPHLVLEIPRATDTPL